MRVRYSRSGTELRFHFLPEADDGQAKDGARLANTAARIELGTASDLHPDLLALSAFLIGGPFANRRLSFALGISERLAHALSLVRPDCTMGPVDRGLAPRSRPMAGRPGLSFSGGVDSTAALEVMPENAEPVFLRRLSPDTDVARYPKSTAGGLAACAKVMELGRHVTVVGTDLEYVREPTGFPDHMSPAVPIVLLADALNIDSVGWGTIGEAAYRYGSGYYRDFSARTVFTQYNALFAAVGLPFCNPVVGVSEVGTAEILRRSRLAGSAQSCMRGGAEPCGACKVSVRPTAS